VADLSAQVQQTASPVIVKEPAKSLTMIKMREPVKQNTFYLGEVIVCDAAVEIGDTKGIAAMMGDDLDKVLNMAIIDAAINKGIFADMNVLLDLEQAQQIRDERENALHLKTMVNFESMDQDTPADLATNPMAERGAQ